MSYKMPLTAQAELTDIFDIYRGKVPKEERRRIARKYGWKEKKVYSWFYDREQRYGWCGATKLFSNMKRFCSRYPGAIKLPEKLETEFWTVFMRMYQIIAMEKAKQTAQGT